MRLPASTTLRRSIWPPAALVLLLVALWLILEAYGQLVIIRVAIQALINMVFVIGLFSFTGLSGTLSFGHISFAALGAYTCAYLTIPVALKPTVFPDMPGSLSWLLEVHTGFVPAILIAGAVAAAFALLIAPAVVRLSPLQGAIATLALLVIVYTVLSNWNDVTRGQSSLFGVPADLTLRMAVAVAVVALLVAWAFSRSGAGLRLRASRDDAIAARAVGIRLARDRTKAWVVSAFLTGAGGAAFAHFIPTFTPAQFYLQATFVTVAMLILGGIGSLSGAVFGTILYSVLAEVLRRLQGGELIGAVTLPPGTSEMLLAVLLLLVIVSRPRGLMGGREIGWPSIPARVRPGRLRERRT